MEIFDSRPGSARLELENPKMLAKLKNGFRHELNCVDKKRTVTMFEYVSWLQNCIFTVGKFNAQFFQYIVTNKYREILIKIPRGLQVVCYRLELSLIAMPKMNWPVYLPVYKFYVGIVGKTLWAFSWIKNTTYV